MAGEELESDEVPFHRRVGELPDRKLQSPRNVVAGPLTLITTRRFLDERGWFSETYVEKRWREAGVEARFVQDNHSYSALVGTIRGIHFQLPPHAQAKLVRCARGRILDYAIDLRSGSPTYGRFEAVELSADNGLQLFIPAGFGHAFVTLERDCDVVYKVDDYYVPQLDAGIRWDCPDIGIDWPLPASGPVLSHKDTQLPYLCNFESPFEYDGRPLNRPDA